LVNISATTGSEKRNKDTRNSAVRKTTHTVVGLGGRANLLFLRFLSCNSFSFRKQGIEFGYEIKIMGSGKLQCAAERSSLGFQ
jgi:hypothetical protein